jgi:hypothetical protein
VTPLEAGQPAPADGWFVPPAVMQEMVPCLDERFRDGAPLPPPEIEPGEPERIEFEESTTRPSQAAADR